MLSLKSLLNVRGKLLKAFEEWKIPLIDELDVIPNDTLMRIKHLFTLKPWQLYSPQEDWETEYIMQNTCVVATANIKSAKHPNREDIDPAILRLFDTLHITYLPKAEAYDLALINLMEKQGFISWVWINELDNKEKSLLPLLVYCLKEIEQNYLGTSWWESIVNWDSSKEEMYLKKAILEIWKFIWLFTWFKESGHSFVDYIKKWVIESCTNTAYPISDRLILIKIFSSKWFIVKQDLQSLLERMDDISEADLDKNIITEKNKFETSDIGFVDEYELANLDPYKVRNLDKLDLINSISPILWLLKKLSNDVLGLDDSNEKEKLQSLILDLLEKFEVNKWYILEIEEKNSLIELLYVLRQKDWIFKFEESDDFIEELCKKLYVYDLKDGEWLRLFKESDNKEGILDLNVE